MPKTQSFNSNSEIYANCWKISGLDLQVAPSFKVLISTVVKPALITLGSGSHEPFIATRAAPVPTAAKPPKLSPIKSRRLIHVGILVLPTDYCLTMKLAISSICASVRVATWGFINAFCSLPYEPSL